MIPSIGGAEVELTEAQIPVGAVTVHSNLSWSPDGKWLAYPDRDSAKDPTGIFLISLETRQKRRLTSTEPAIQGDECPSFSPDGRSLAFARFVNYNLSHLYVLPLTPAMEAAGQPRQITFGDLLSASPVWTPDGRQIIYVSGPKHHLRPLAARSSKSREIEASPVVLTRGHQQVGATSTFARRTPARVCSTTFGPQHLANWPVLVGTTGWSAHATHRLDLSRICAPVLFRTARRLLFSPTAPERLRSGSATALDRTLFN